VLVDRGVALGVSARLGELVDRRPGAVGELDGGWRVRNGFRPGLLEPDAQCQAPPQECSGWSATGMRLENGSARSWISHAVGDVQEVMGVRWTS
jgi:hypothetical protein